MVGGNVFLASARRLQGTAMFRKQVEGYNLGRGGCLYHQHEKKVHAEERFYCVLSTQVEKHLNYCRTSY